MAAGARKAACSCARDHCSSDGNQGRDSATSKGERGTVRSAHGAVCRSLFMRLYCSVLRKGGSGYRLAFAIDSLHVGNLAAERFQHLLDGRILLGFLAQT